MTSARNISAIHTGENAIMSSSMSYFLGCNYCDAALHLVPGQQLIYDRQRSIERHGNRKFIYDLQNLSLGARKAIDNGNCNYFTVELSVLSSRPAY